MSDDLPVIIDTSVSPNHWDIVLFLNRKKPRVTPALGQLLYSLHIPFFVWANMRGLCHYYRVQLNADEPLDNVKRHLQDIIDKIDRAASQAHRE